MGKPNNIRKIRVQFDLIISCDDGSTNPHKWDWYGILDLGVNESMANLTTTELDISDQDWDIIGEDWGDCWNE